MLRDVNELVGITVIDMKTGPLQILTWANRIEDF